MMSNYAIGSTLKNYNAFLDLLLSLEEYKEIYYGVGEELVNFCTL